MAAMSAAEKPLPGPTSRPASSRSGSALAQAIFHEYTTRWDAAGCGGRSSPSTAGYDYKNAIANGCFFNIAARLARFTGNGWAGRVLKWEQGTGLIALEYRVYEGATNCTRTTPSSGATIRGSTSTAQP